jgi:hypothetical protein
MLVQGQAAVQTMIQNLGGLFLMQQQTADLAGDKNAEGRQQQSNQQDDATPPILQFNSSYLSGLQSNQLLPVVMHNTLAWERNEYAIIYVSRDDLIVLDSEGAQPICNTRLVTRVLNCCPSSTLTLNIISFHFVYAVISVGRFREIADLLP